MPHNRICRRNAGQAALMRAAGGAALAALVMCSNAGVAHAEDDGASIYDKFMQVLGLKRSGPEYTIEYNERSPLVVPPTRNLPPPVASNPNPAPDWPKDPDMKRRLDAKVKEKPKPHVDYASDLLRPLRPNELDVPGGSTTSANSSATNTANGGTVEPPKKSIFGFGWLKKEEYATFTGEPARSNLTDPPAGYLTPSPDQPYGITAEKKQVKPSTVGERMEPTR